jgi:Flp pilus assembly protein TadG
MLILGMFTGGIAYNRNISVTNAVREGSRYGATLPVSGDITTWLRTVAQVVQDNATGDLGAGAPNRRICVAYVTDPTSATANDRIASLTVTTGSIAAATPSFTRCKLADGSDYVDGMPDNQRRVNVVASRTSDLEAGFWKWTLTLQSKSVTRFEAFAS